VKKYLFCVLLIFTCFSLFAQQQPVVAVAPFDAISGISTMDANMITRVFFIRLGNTNKVSLVDRNVVDRVLREHSFQTGDWSNQQKTAELGSALNADWIVRGELEKFGNNILVTVQFYDIRTFRFMGGSDLLLANTEEAMTKMDPLVNKLVETIAVNPSTGGQRQTGNTGASTYYGTWVLRGSSWNDTLNIEENRIIHRYNGPPNTHIVISNPTWTTVSNTDPNTLSDYPRGFKIFGAVTETSRGDPNSWRPIFIFVHRNDNNRMLLYCSPDSNSEIQNANPRHDTAGPFGRVQ